ncbi:molecular chaperone DnaJ, partial [Tremellales sp. Uapishka_1]
MPPRLSVRAVSALPFTSQAVASSSAVPLPPRPISPTSKRLYTASTSNPRLNVGGHRRNRAFHSSATDRAAAKDPYKVLGVAKDATSSDIKKTYYQLAKKWHPDTNKDKGANERFLEIQNAYDILSDDSKRQAYDQYGAASQQEGFDPNSPRGAGGFGGFQDFGSAFGGRGGNTGDLFESLFGGSFGGGSPFGGGGSRQRPVKGDDLEATVTLSFMESCAGTKKKINIRPVVDCQPCSGSGLKPGEKKSSCATCRGTGQQQFQIQGMIMASTCQTCGGSGSTIPKSARCGECDGVGKVKEKKEIEVEIPAGIEDGMKIKLPNEGDKPLSATGPPGDLFVRINVKPSSVFRRQGTNIYHDAKVPLYVALLGGKMRIPTLEGDVEVRVREGTQNGEEAVLKGRGVKSVYGRGARNERGDLIVAWKIQIPRSLSSFQKKILRAYADDVEGKPPYVSFDPPASSSGTSSSAPPPITETPSAPTPDSNSSTGRPRSTSPPPPFVETEPGPNSPSHPQGVVGVIASAIGGALGWAERFFGSRK